MRNPLLIQPNFLLQKLYSKAVWNMDRDEKSIYLTFDDGPVPGLTEWVLDELKSFKASATFFCVGSNIRKHPQIFKRIIDENHRVANHTMEHVKGFRTPLARYMSQAEECRQMVRNDLFRPPYGQLRRMQYKTLVKQGYRIILWDVISYDYESISPEQCEQNVLRNARAGSIVLFHDNVKAEENLKFVLPRTLDYFSSRGYTFKSLPA